LPLRVSVEAEEAAAAARLSLVAIKAAAAEQAALDAVKAARREQSAGGKSLLSPRPALAEAYADCLSPYMKQAGDASDAAQVRRNMARACP
jgi:hypothetical protein